MSAIDPWLAEYEAAEKALPRPRLTVVREPEWVSTVPPAGDLRPKSLAVHGQEPTTVWTYHASDGAPIGYVCRYDDKGKKKVLTWSYGRIEGEPNDHWALKAFSKPRPIYGIHAATEKPTAQLVIVEGEKCAAALQSRLEAPVVLTWPGGAQAAKFADWDALAGRERPQAFLWPDNDDAGREAMQLIGERMFLLGFEVTWLDVPADKPQGWDCADLIDEGGSPIQFIRDHRRKFLPAKAEVVLPAEPEPATEPAPLPPTETHHSPNVWRIQQWQDYNLYLLKSKPVANLSNMALVLDVIRPGQIWYDEFLDKIMTVGSDGKTAREWTDADASLLLIEVQRRCGISNASMRDLNHAIAQHAYRDLRNCQIDYIESLEWDQHERIEHFFIEVCGTPDTPYYRAIGRNFFIGMVARALRPGCKLDTMVVLEGTQGSYKSTLLSVLGGPWYAIMRDAPDSKDFGIVLQGKWLIEIAEMDSFSRVDVKATKRTMSTAEDRYRSPYAIHAKDHPRRSIFAGSTNRDDWNSDDTGARRFYPVACTEIRLDLARLYRDQYFAEAREALKAGASWWETPPEETSREQWARFESDPWSDAVRDACLGQPTVKLSWVLSEIGVPIERQDKASQRRVSSILRVLGWTRHQIWHNNRPLWAWASPLTEKPR